MKTKHTAGPWIPDWLGDMHGWILDNDGNYLLEAVTSDSEGKCRPLSECRKNLALAAAAPELLEALRDLVVRIDREHETGEKVKRADMQRARYLILRADGE